MAYQTGVITALRDWGLVVVEVPGWRTRGSSIFSPRGHVCHHDVVPDNPGTNDHIPNIIVNGRSDLPGPLAHFWLETDGDVHICAAGRANHAGSGGWHGLTQNSEVWGTEANNMGTPATPWPDEQLEAWYKLCAATCDFSNFSAEMVCGHKEWAPTRKIDPHSLNMNEFRHDVATADKGGFLVGADADRVVNALQRQTAVIQSQGKKDRANATRLAALDRAQRARLANDDAAEKAATADVAAADKALAEPEPADND